MQSFDFFTWTTLATRNLTLAEAKSLNIVSACNGCFETLKIADYHMRHDKGLNDAVNKILEKETGRVWKGSITISHIVEYLEKEYTLKRLAEKIVAPLHGMKVVTHVGCHFMKPQHIMQTDNPNYPVVLNKILELLNIQVLPYFGETACCGAGVRGVDTDLALSIAINKLIEMDATEADGIVVICPTCFNSFDSQQKLANRKIGRKKELPVFHLFELLALALGTPIDELGLQNHMIKVDLGKLVNAIRLQTISVTH
jgi:heterodisulfide reductase subunit B